MADEFTWTEDEPSTHPRAEGPASMPGTTAQPSRVDEAGSGYDDEPDGTTRISPRRLATTTGTRPSWTPPTAAQQPPVQQTGAAQVQREPRYAASQPSTSYAIPADQPVMPHAPAPEGSEALTPDRLLDGRRTPPERGMRKFLYALTGGSVNLGDPPAVVHRKALEARVRATLTGQTRFVAVLSRKGGVGKTTTTVTLGKTLATLRDDRICAIDGNPDRGTLVDLVERGTSSTVFDVAEGIDRVTHFADMSKLVSRDPSRLDVVASDVDPQQARGFGAHDYLCASHLLSRFYSIVLTDTGLDFTHEIQRAILDRADAIVVVAGGSFVEARLAAETLDVITAMGYGHLASRATVAIQSASQTPVKVGEIQRHFATRVQAVVQIPRDEHLAEGSRLDLNRLAPPTRLAALELAAHVVDSLTIAHPRHPRSTT